MKTKTCWLFLSLACAVVCSLLFVPTTYAQSDVPTQAESQVLSPATQNLILSVFTTAAAKYPWLATIVAVVGSMRLWAKPVFSALHALSLITPNKWDDGIYARLHDFFVDTAAGKFLAYLLDWVASIKIAAPGPVIPRKEGQ